MQYTWNDQIFPLGNNALREIKSTGPIVAKVIAKILNLPPQLAQVFARISGEIKLISDVFKRREDLDATFTAEAGHFHNASTHFIHPSAMPYIAELLVYLRDEELKEISDIIHNTHTKLSEICHTTNDIWDFLPADVIRRIRQLVETTDRINLNSAPRNQTANERDTDNPSQQKNGGDYFVAITDTGMEFTVASLSILKYIRDRIVGIFRIPDGVAWPKGEQFRSRKVAVAAHTYPFEMVPVWIKNQTRESINEWIPLTEEKPHVAYIDSFENRRVRVDNLKKFWGSAISKKTDRGTVFIQIGTTVIECYVGTNLASSPGGQYSVYLNPADHNNAQGGYVEFTMRLPNGVSIEEIWKHAGPHNPSTQLNPDDRGLRTLVTVLTPEEGIQKLAQHSNPPPL